MTLISSNTLQEARLAALKELSEWRKLLKHFKLAPDLFAFIPVFVPDSDWEEVCRQSLAESLRAFEKKGLYVIALEKPEELKNLAVTIFDLKFEKKKYGAVWITAPVTLRDDEREDWQAAWREGMARLNQYRNPFRRMFDFPVLLIGGEWTKEIIRDAAPDLWSVRTIVIRIEPPIISSADIERVENVSSTGSYNSWRNVDPEFALREAARLRGQTGKELGLARLLFRAANGFNARSKYKQALEAAREADISVSQLLVKSANTSTNKKDIVSRSDFESFRADVLTIKGIAFANLGKLNEAILEHNKAIEIYQRLIEENRDELEDSLATALMHKGIALEHLGKLNEALVEYDKAIAIHRILVEEEKLSELANQFASVLVNKGNVLYKLDKFNEAIIEYDKAIKIRLRLVEEENHYELADDLAIALVNKGNVLIHLGKVNKAIVEYDKAISILQRLIEENRDELEDSLATALMNKGSALQSLYKFKKAIVEYDKAIEILRRLVEEENRDELANSLAMALMNKGNAFVHLNRLKKAIVEYDDSERVRENCLQRGELHILPEFVTNIRNRIYQLIDLKDWKRIADDALRISRINEQVKHDEEFPDYFKQQISEQVRKILSYLHQVSPDAREKIYLAAGEKGEFLRQFVESNQ